MPCRGREMGGEATNVDETKLRGTCKRCGQEVGVFKTDLGAWAPIGHKFDPKAKYRSTR
jgi:hypothetical protein